MKNKTRDEDDANQSLFSAAGVRPNHPFSKTTHFADISNGVVATGGRQSQTQPRWGSRTYDFTQGSSFLATLGWATQSLQD
jgi:hypothetical protein